MSNLPENLKYSKEHEWVRVDGNRAYVGITYFAQDELGDIVFVDLPEVGAELAVNESFGTVESVKTTSDLFAPVAGRVVEVNQSLQDKPETINTDPYHEGWMLVVEMSDPKQVSQLLDSAAYQEYVDQA